MDQQNSFSSDSTYCSVYENSRSINKNRKRMKSQSASKILEKIHNDVLLHLEGVTLLGNLEVARCMKEISGLKLSAKKKTTAEKIQMSLFKIYKCNEYFQNTFVRHGQYRKMNSDPVEHCGVTQDIQMLRNYNEKELKQVSIPRTDSSKSYSFQSDMLTNKNFLPESSLQSTKTSAKHVNEELLKNGEMKISNEVCVNKISDKQNVYLNSMDMFLSQDNKNMEISKAPNIIHQLTDGVQVSTVTSGNPRTLSEKLLSTQMKMKSPHYSQDSEVYLESCSSSFNDTMFKVPVLKYKRKRKYRRIEQSNMSATNCINGEIIGQNHFERENQNARTNSVGINKTFSMNKSNQFQLNESRVFSEHFIRSKNDDENSITSDSDSTLSDNELQLLQPKNPFISQYSKNSNYQMDCSNQPKNFDTSNETQSTLSPMKLALESEKNAFSQKDSDSGEELQTMATRIQKINDTCFQRVNFFSKVIPETNTQIETTEQPDFDSVKIMGKSFVEIYNKKIEKIQCDIGNNTKSWEEIKDELDYVSEINKNTMGALADMFEKVSIDERKTIENLHTKKLEGADFLELNEEDAKELDLKSLRLSNEVRLKELSLYFKRKLTVEENKSEGDIPGDYTEYYSRLVDWRKL